MTALTALTLCCLPLAAAALSIVDTLRTYRRVAAEARRVDEAFAATVLRDFGSGTDHD